MNSKKIALIIFLIALIILSVGVIVYVERQRSEVGNLRAHKLSVPPATTSKIPASGNSAIKPTQPITEEQIQAKIEAKKKQISQEAKGRPYTSEELLFIASPRQAVINDLQKNQ